MRAALTRVAEELELRLASDDRRRVDLRLVARSDGVADVVRRDGALLALDEQRLLLGRVDRLRAVEDVGGGEDVAGLRARGESRREVDGVAHHGVRAPRRAADVAGEDVAAVHACAERQADVGRDDRRAAPAAFPPRPGPSSTARRR